MARIRQNAMKYVAEDFIREMRAAGCRKGLNSVTAIADYCGMRRDTLQNRVKSPEGLKFGEIWLLTWKLGMKEATTDCLRRGEKVS